MASQVHEASPADLVIWLEAADGRCGAKAAQLGRLLRTGFHVPAGFVVVDALGDDSWAGELEAALRQLGPGPFAVRSSAMCEDGPEASYAGQLDTTLGVTTPREVADALRSCAASGNTLRTLAYATRRGHPRHPTAESSDPRTVPASVPASVPVIVQLRVPADVSGVLFTRHPVTGGDAVIIEAAPGLGDQVVEGRVTPQRWGVSDHVVIAPAPAPGSDGELVLTAGQVLDIARTGRLVEAELAGPQDIEWALADGVLWVLQARPITTTALLGSPATTDARTSGAAVRLLVRGTGSSPGSAAGPARVIDGLDDFDRFRPGDVLVCRATSPAWTPLLARAAAVVTEVGGILSHTAIVAREFGIPAVTGVDDATTALSSGERVIVDGTDGSVSTVVHSQGRPITEEGQ
ncbi:hypothetical protein ASG96_04125 [Terrabacter sp. Soil810]|nr:hypothetical protein ASG96_04125 [Terrabacter sp. Soil810]